MVSLARTQLPCILASSAARRAVRRGHASCPPNAAQPLPGRPRRRVGAPRNGERMTVGIAINCTDGIVMACDSLATYSRGAPVARHTNKVHVIQHDGLENPVTLIGAGMMAFID